MTNRHLHLIRRQILLLILSALAFCASATVSRSLTPVEEELLGLCKESAERRDYRALHDAAVRLQAEAGTSGHGEAADYGLASRLYAMVMGYLAGPTDELYARVARRVESRREGKDDMATGYLVLAMGFYEMTCGRDFNKAASSAFRALRIARSNGFCETETRALGLLASIYFDRDDKEGLRMARECLRTAEKCGSLASRYSGYKTMAAYMARFNKFGEAERYADLADSVITVAGIAGERYYITSLRGDICFRKGDTGGAGRYYQKALMESRGSGPEAVWYAATIYGSWLNDQGRYAEAIERLDEAENAMKGHKAPLVSWYGDLVKSEAYSGMGRYREAYEAHQRYAGKRMALMEKENEKEFKSLELKYKVAEQKMENDRQKIEVMEKSRLATVVSAICAVLLVVLVAVAVVYLRSIRHYRRLVNVNLTALSREKHLRRELAKAIDGNGGGSGGAATDDRRSSRADEIYRRLVGLMEEKRVYLDPALSLDALAAMAGTNRTYLQEAIRISTGLTYSSYINDLRISHAIDLLTQSDSAEVIKTLAAASGFESPSNFYRRFKKKTGVSPAMFRMQAKEGDAEQEG